MPRHVRMRCPGCGVYLRVPGAVINHDVCCKFCKEVFRAAPALASTRETTAAAPAGEAASLAPPGDPAAPTPNPGNGRPLGAPLVRERLESQTRLEEPAAISLEPPHRVQARMSQNSRRNSRPFGPNSTGWNERIKRRRRGSSRSSGPWPASWASSRRSRRHCVDLRPSTDPYQSGARGN